MKIAAECREPASRSDSPVKAQKNSAKMKGAKDMKYILMMNTMKSRRRSSGIGRRRRSQAHIAFMHSFNKDLRESGELVSAEGLAFPIRPGWCGPARTARPSRTAYFPEAKEFLAGYWIVDVESPERAYAIAARASAAPGPGGQPLNMPIEVRQVMSGPPPEDAVTACHDRDAGGHPSEHLLRELAPQVLGAVIRRFRDFAAAEDAVQEALIAAAVQWPREGVPDNPRAWLIQVASRRMTDHLRSEMARRRRETAVAMEIGPTAAGRRSYRVKRIRTTRSSCSSCAVIPP